MLGHSQSATSKIFAHLEGLVMPAREISETEANYWQCHLIADTVSAVGNTVFINCGGHGEWSTS